MNIALSEQFFPEFSTNNIVRFQRFLSVSLWIVTGLTHIIFCFVDILGGDRKIYEILPAESC